MKNATEMNLYRVTFKTENQESWEHFEAKIVAPNIPSIMANLDKLDIKPEEVTDIKLSDTLALVITE